jgi:trans-2,3-dihydro-3-hydroxyanthranilate isomerase
MDLSFELLDVFAIEGLPFSGNPLCVFTDGGAMPTATMQAWARQFNLSESTFVTSTDGAGEASVRIFTPGHEMPFAGHPTLGTAHVVAGLTGGPCDLVHLSMPAGRIPVTRVDGGWRLTAPPATTRPVAPSPADLSAALGIEEGAVVRPDASWVHSGVEQLLVRVGSVDDVRACAPDPRLMTRHMTSEDGVAHVYVWAWSGRATIEARLFFTQDASVIEDPATGSACANLGGWLATQGTRDIVIEVSQGRAVGRPSRIVLEVDAAGVVHVGGRVERVGAGTVSHRDDGSPAAWASVGEQA